MLKSELKKQIQDFPRRPGIYIFKDLKGRVLYVGKALSLRDRLLNYIQKDILPKTVRLVESTAAIEYIETGGEFEALLLEANLIQKYWPKYNVVFRDDKSYLYIFISTGEQFPRIYVTRKPKAQNNVILESVSDSRIRARNGSWTSQDDSRIISNQHNSVKGVYFGPYPSSRTVREVLKMLRRIFPFCQQKKLGVRPCFYSHIGLCCPCPAQIVKEPPEVYAFLKKVYRRNLLAIKAVLAGRLKKVEKSLAKAMSAAALKNEFEEAALFRDKLFRLKSLTEAHQSLERFLENPNFYFEESLSTIEELRKILGPHFPNMKYLQRIECFDVSHFQGSAAVGGEVVFVEGVPEKTEYRRFSLRTKGPNDVSQMREMLSRRLAHTEWVYPDLVIVDGGKPQVSQIHKLFEEKNLNIPLLGLAKRLEEIIILRAGIFKIIRLPRASRALKLLQSVRDETHRFAISYHRKKLRLLT